MKEPEDKPLEPREPEEKQLKKPERDLLKKIKYIGYCWSNLPIDEYGLEEYVNYAKFQLCIKNKVLMNDPVWKTYKREQILAEFYAHIFAENEVERRRFEATIGASEDVYDWLDRMVEQNQEEHRKMLEGTEDSLEFTPETLGE